MLYSGAVCWSPFIHQSNVFWTFVYSQFMHTSNLNVFSWPSTPFSVALQLTGLEIPYLPLTAAEGWGWGREGAA